MNDAKKAKLVLIVDDEEAVARMLKAGLEDRGYQVLTAKTGEEAVEIASKIIPDLIILDYNLGASEITGEQVCVIIKNNHPTIPMIVTSGVADRMNISDILRACADKFVAKGGGIRYLLNLVEQYLN